MKNKKKKIESVNNLVENRIEKIDERPRKEIRLNDYIHTLVYVGERPGNLLDPNYMNNLGWALKSIKKT